MSESVLAAVDVRDPLARADAAVTELAAAELTRCTDEDIVELWRRLEGLRRRLPVLEHALITEAEARTLPFRHGCKTVVQFARHLLHISPGEAAGRVRAAHRLGARHNPHTGQPLGPVCPAIAAAQAGGEISAQHAEVIVATLEALPDEVTASRDREIEDFLVSHARVLDPATLGKAAHRLRATLDPDGRLRDESAQQRRRGLTLHRRPDGSARLEAELTAECAEHLDTHLDVLGRPAPAAAPADGTKDPRSPAQRRHDALLAMLQLVERAALLPQTAGVTATIVLHMDADTFATGHGTATTGHGYTIPADLALTWCGPKRPRHRRPTLQTRRIEAYSTTQRIFTEQQRLALRARDLGCSFPTCDATALWTEAHHVIDYAAGGPTSTDNGTLACGHDHDHHQAMGWHCQMTNGTPHWQPPTWIDPQQQPIPNRLHDPLR